MREEELDIKGLVRGVELGAEKVSQEICPECPFKKPHCEFRMAIWLKDSNLAFSCRGMRAYVDKSN